MSSNLDLNTRLAVLEEEDSLDYSEEVNEAGLESERWLVGRFMTEKTVNLLAMRHVMVSIWKPVRKMKVSELKHNIFLFQFYHEMDLARVVEEGPWTFEHYLFLFQSNLSRSGVKLGGKWLRDDRVQKEQDDVDVEALNGKIFENLNINNSNLNFEIGKSTIQELIVSKGNGNYRGGTFVGNSGNQKIPTSKGFVESVLVKVDNVVEVDAKRKRVTNRAGFLDLDNGPNVHESDIIMGFLHKSPK